MEPWVRAVGSVPGCPIAILPSFPVFIPFPYSSIMPAKLPPSPPILMTEVACSRLRLYASISFLCVDRVNLRVTRVHWGQAANLLLCPAVVLL